MMDKPHELSQRFQSVCQKSRTLHILLLNVNQSLKKSKPLGRGFSFRVGHFLPSDENCHALKDLNAND